MILKRAIQPGFLESALAGGGGVGVGGGGDRSARGQQL